MPNIDKNSGIIYENTVKRNTAGMSQYDQLVKAGEVIPYHDGRPILGGSFVYLMNRFDKLFCCWAKEDLAKEITVPDFYHEEDLNQCKYLDQFHPQCVFASCSQNDDLDSAHRHYTGYINNPAVCMHCYILHKDTAINDDKLIRLTMKGRCKRQEVSGYHTLERLHDFTMREIVFIGSEIQIIEKRDEYLKKAEDFISTLQLEGNIKIANDPFFKKADAAKAEFQKKFKLKYEMNLINWDTGNEIAVGSFNYHHTHFAAAYNIQLSNGQPAHSCCIAFGLERLTYTVVSQIGVQKALTILNEYLEAYGYA